MNNCHCILIYSFKMNVTNVIIVGLLLTISESRKIKLEDKRSNKAISKDIARKEIDPESLRADRMIKSKDKGLRCECCVYLHAKGKRPTTHDYNYEYQGKYGLPKVSTCNDICLIQPALIHNLAKKSKFCKPRIDKTTNMISIYYRIDHSAKWTYTGVSYNLTKCCLDFHQSLTSCVREVIAETVKFPSRSESELKISESDDENNLSEESEDEEDLHSDTLSEISEDARSEVKSEDMSENLSEKSQSILKIVDSDSGVKEKSVKTKKALKKDVKKDAQSRKDPQPAKETLTRREIQANPKKEPQAKKEPQKKVTKKVQNNGDESRVSIDAPRTKAEVTVGSIETKIKNYVERLFKGFSSQRLSKTTKPFRPFPDSTSSLNVHLYDYIFSDVDAKTKSKPSRKNNYNQLYKNEKKYLNDDIKNLLKQLIQHKKAERETMAKISNKVMSLRKVEDTDGDIGDEVVDDDTITYMSDNDKVIIDHAHHEEIEIQDVHPKKAIERRFGSIEDQEPFTTTTAHATTDNREKTYAEKETSEESLFQEELKKFKNTNWEQTNEEYIEEA